MSFYVLDENNNRYEALDKEGVLAVLDQAIKDGTINNIVADAAFISKLKCCVTGGTNNVAFVTQQKYNELKAANQLRENTLYYITDDPTAEELDAILQALSNSVSQLLINCSNNTNNINRLLPTIPELLPINSDNTVDLKKSGLYAIEYLNSTETMSFTVMLSYNVNYSNVAPRLADDNLEVKQESRQYLFVRPKDVSDYHIVKAVLVTQY